MKEIGQSCKIEVVNRLKERKRGIFVEDQLTQSSMEILLKAGDAREECFKALEFVSEGNIESARKKLNEAKETIVEAHRVHTACLQASMEKENNMYSMLFAHAQDTLMTINTEINLTARFIDIFENYNKRLEILENRDKGEI